MTGLGLYDSSVPAGRKRAAFTSGEVPVAVYGLGKMGLPLATVYAETAGDVIGVDVDPSVVEAVNAGECHVTGEPGLPDALESQVERDRLRATTDGSAAAAARVHVVIVPTLLSDDREPDLSTVEAVADDIAAGLAPGDLVILESTVPPGTCRDVLRPHLAAESGLEPDAFGLAFCPERTSTGTALRDIRGAYPKVVGGVDDESTRAAALIYDELTENEVHVVSGATTAEAVKVFEGVYRDVNIALANEFARIADDLGTSVREAIATANELPVCDIHDPGPGVGGHCIPYYPYFLFAQAEKPLPVTRAARDVNEGMPAHTVAVLADELAADDLTLADASVLVLGLTYRAGVEETRASPGVDVVSILAERGADVFAADPLVDPADYGATPVALESIPSGSFDAVVLVTPHEEFERIEWESLDPTVVLDGRDALEIEGTETSHRVRTLGGSRNGGPTVLERPREEPVRSGADGDD
ncbi:nucleotide sugar dehydrogenase [Natrialbaceae archaeon AArc-T1-2]|uniref:nucleotide sugar dehydrogenase n=1 Tax=Natrialbaceae archaeon AArc-T1-2 TaxID=3053904 RepID=UPI00255A840B|nr:nucleotide sugar dehydrogenase [Natrialbaceae archaeon AArc-T1-2]WIV66177.1 nucleotide sugar dehydrogenase [Natrialbaceae archaeon AArc-T1-2]